MALACHAEADPVQGGSRFVAEGFNALGQIAVAVFQKDSEQVVDFAEGDLVEVLLRPSKAAVGKAKTKAGVKTDVVYLVNGEEVGVAAVVDAPADVGARVYQAVLADLARTKLAGQQLDAPEGTRAAKEKEKTNTWI